MHQGADSVSKRSVHIVAKSHSHAWLNPIW